MKHGKLPSFKEIQDVVNENPHLTNRTLPQFKTWIHNKLKKKETDST